MLGHLVNLLNQELAQLVSFVLNGHLFRNSDQIKENYVFNLKPSKMLLSHKPHLEKLGYLLWGFTVIVGCDWRFAMHLMEENFTWILCYINLKILKRGLKDVFGLHFVDLDKNFLVSCS